MSGRSTFPGLSGKMATQSRSVFLTFRFRPPSSRVGSRSAATRSIRIRGFTTSCVPVSTALRSLRERFTASVLGIVRLLKTSYGLLPTRIPICSFLNRKGGIPMNIICRVFRRRFPWKFRSKRCEPSRVWNPCGSSDRLMPLNMTSLIRRNFRRRSNRGSSRGCILRARSTEQPVTKRRRRRA